jgi:hypothetical protein
MPKKSKKAKGVKAPIWRIVFVDGSAGDAADLMNEMEAEDRQPWVEFHMGNADYESCYVIIGRLK